MKITNPTVFLKDGELYCRTSETESVKVKNGDELVMAWGESTFDKDVYQLGMSADENDENPFPENTNAWYNWNRGFNCRE